MYNLILDPDSNKQLKTIMRQLGRLKYRLISDYINYELIKYNNGSIVI